MDDLFALSRVRQLKVTEADYGVDALRKLATGKFDQTLVGTRNVMTDSDGNWSGQVMLTGETTPTEVVTATATRFT